MADNQRQHRTLALLLFHLEIPDTAVCMLYDPVNSEKSSRVEDPVSDVRPTFLSFLLTAYDMMRQATH